MGCCLTRNKEKTEEIEERDVANNKELRRILKEKETVIEGPQTVVPSKRNNTSIMEDNMPEANPYMEESFRKKPRRMDSNINKSIAINTSNRANNINNSTFMDNNEVNDNHDFFNNDDNFNLIKPSRNNSVNMSRKKELLDRSDLVNMDSNIVLKFLNFELNYSDFFNVFRVKLEPLIKIHFEDQYYEFEHSHVQNENLNDSMSTSKYNVMSSIANKTKTKKFFFQDKSFTIKNRSILNNYSMIYLNILQKNENEMDKISFVIGEAFIPINLIHERVKLDLENSLITIPIINTVENIILGILSIELSNSINYYDDSHQNSIVKQKNRLDTFLKLQILNFNDIDPKHRKKYFNFSKKDENHSIEEGNKHLEKYSTEIFKNYIFSGKFNELKQELIDEERKIDEIKFYNLMYVLNEIIELEQFKKVDPSLFKENFLYHFLDNRKDKLKNIFMFEIQLRFLIKVKEKGILGKDIKFQLINLEKIINFIKQDVFQFIISALQYHYENYEKNLSKIKKNECFVNFSDPELICLKNIIYMLLYLIRIILKDECELDRKEKDKSKMKIDDINKKIVEKDINCFRHIFKEMLLIQNEFLLKDCNIAFGITKCFASYIKLTKKFCFVRNFSKTTLILETFLNENSDLLHWLLKLYSIYLTNKKFYLDFLEISNELIEDCFGVFLINYLNVFNIKFIIRSFLPYHKKISSENFKIWYYYLSILSKISCLVRKIKDQNLDFFTLSNSDTSILMNEVINVFTFFDSNPYFSINQESVSNKKFNNDQKLGKSNNFFDMPMCIQMQLKSLELLKNITRNEYFMKCFLVDAFSYNNNPENIKNIFNRIINLLFFDSSKIIQDQNLKLYDNIILNIVYIFHFLMNEIEIYRVFFCEIWKDLIEVDFLTLVKKLIDEIEILKEVNKENVKLFCKLEEFSNDFLKINNLFLFK